MWFANEIITLATAPAVDWVQRHEAMRGFAYVVRSLDGYAWHSDEVRHGLPPEGLLFVQPIASPIGLQSQLSRAEVLSWDGFAGDAMQHLNPSAGACLAELTDDCPPPSFRAFLASAAETLGQPVVYFSSAMFGGAPELEYALVYAPDEEVHVTNGIGEEMPPACPLVEDALRVALAVLGLHLPTSFFAPHTGQFSWSRPVAE